MRNHLPRRGALAAAGLAALLGTAGVGAFSVPPPADGIGVADGRLRPVPTDRRNAVSSFADTEYHRIAPLDAAPDPRAAFERLARVVRAWPDATVVAERPGYLHAEFRTPLMRFVDDVEFLLDEPAAVIHVRSASRLGRSDFGANRKRVEAIRARYQSSPPSDGESK
ncbi:MAG TPA: DUF1499 domain-containing protein [Quisquiliibacterium sp.]|nr:DUF1499 domain-containing protein [Quisquiliibacterium sp.]